MSANMNTLPRNIFSLRNMKINLENFKDTIIPLFEPSADKNQLIQMSVIIWQMFMAWRFTDWAMQTPNCVESTDNFEGAFWKRKHWAFKSLETSRFTRRIRMKLRKYGAGSLRRAPSFMEAIDHI